MRGAWGGAGNGEGKQEAADDGGRAGEGEAGSPAGGASSPRGTPLLTPSVSPAHTARDFAPHFRSAHAALLPPCARRTLEPYEGSAPCNTVAFDSSGSYLAVGGQDARIYGLKQVGRGGRGVFSRLGGCFLGCFLWGKRKGRG